MNGNELVNLYHALNLPICYWERKGKDPREWKGPHEKGWNDPARQYAPERFDPARMNVGIFTGTEIAPGKYLTDVDFDWAPGLDLAKRIIPSTSFAFGRKGKKISHAFFTVTERLGVTKYCDIDEEKGTGEGETFVELRGGDRTHQTMVAPSLHSPGVQIELVLQGPILHVEARRLEQAVTDYAIACLVLKHAGGGLHHDGRIALAGFLLRGGIPPERALIILEEVCRVQAERKIPDMSNRDVADASQVIRTTVARLESNKKVAGGPKFATYLGERGRYVVARMNKWLGREGDAFIRSEDGRIIAKSQENIRQALTQLDCTFSYNTFAEKPLMNGEPFDDHVVEHLHLKVDEAFGFLPSLEFFRQVINNEAWQNRFHPVKDYLAKLRWDGVARIDRWLIVAAGAKDIVYVRAVSAIMLIAAVRRVKHPGCKYDEMVVWESKQGSYKSSAARALCPNPDWFSDDLALNLKSQQLIEATLGKWIVEASDLAGKRKAELEHLKAMLSRQVDGPARMAYAHYPVERPRHFIIVGTTNSVAYLPDSTGSRRFWPITVREFNVEWIKKNRDQLWAEAATREEEGATIRLPQALWPEASKEQEERREIDPWEGLIRSALLTVAPSTDGKRRVTTDAVWEVLGIAADRRDRIGSMRMGEIMQRLGFKRTRVRPPDGVVQVGFVQEEPGALALEGGEDLEGTDEREPGIDDVPF